MNTTLIWKGLEGLADRLAAALAARLARQRAARAAAVRDTGEEA